MAQVTEPTGNTEAHECDREAAQDAPPLKLQLAVDGRVFKRASVRALGFPGRNDACRQAWKASSYCCNILGGGSGPTNAAETSAAKTCSVPVTGDLQRPGRQGDAPTASRGCRGSRWRRDRFLPHEAARTSIYRAVAATGCGDNDTTVRSLPSRACPAASWHGRLLLLCRETLGQLLLETLADAEQRPANIRTFLIAAYRYQQLELRDHRPHVTEWRRHEVDCERCGSSTTAAYDSSKIPNSAFGPCLTAVVAMLTGAYHLSRRKTQNRCRRVSRVAIRSASELWEEKGDSAMTTPSLYLGAARPLRATQAPYSLQLPAHHLVTHAVVMGTTGSGKTGLVTVMVEEALRARVPALVVDVKGDLPNLLLSFPSFSHEAFLPWVQNDAHVTTEQARVALAQQLATQRREGPSAWQIGEAALASFRAGTSIRVVTPGATAGEMLHVLSSLERRSSRWDTDAESVRAALSAAVSLLLRLLGRDPDPAKSREHVLLSAGGAAALGRADGGARRAAA